MLKYAADYIRADKFQWYKNTLQDQYQHELRAATLHFARHNTHFYRHLPQTWEEIPFTTKDHLQNQLTEFLSSSHQGVWRSTSGSSGKMVKVFWDERNLVMRMIFMVRAFSMIGYTPFKKLIYALPDQEKAGWTFGLFRHRHISLRASLEENTRLLFSFKPHLLSIYPSYALDLAQSFAGRTPHFLEVISLNSEQVLSDHKKNIEKFFGCPTFDEYSSVEFGVIAAMCKHRQRHIFTDNVFLEVINDQGQVLSDGELGEIVATTLQSKGLPLIRYRTGDLGRIRHNISCPCGRQSPILEDLKGRLDDYLVSPEKGRIPAWQIYESIERPGEKECLFKDIYLEQTSSQELKLHFIADQGFTKDIADIVHHNLQDLFGKKMNIVLQQVYEIQRPPHIKRKYIARNFDGRS